MLVREPDEWGNQPGILIKWVSFYIMLRGIVPLRLSQIPPIRFGLKESSSYWITTSVHIWDSKEDHFWSPFPIVSVILLRILIEKESHFLNWLMRPNFFLLFRIISSYPYWISPRKKLSFPHSSLSVHNCIINHIPLQTARELVECFEWAPHVPTFIWYSHDQFAWLDE